MPYLSREVSFGIDVYKSFFRRRKLQARVNADLICLNALYVIISVISNFGFGSDYTAGFLVIAYHLLLSTINVQNTIN